jgi:hypothetical protein
MWVACAMLNLGTRVAHPGDPVPEADQWPDRDPWIAFGHIRWAPDAPRQEVATSSAITASEPGNVAEKSEGTDSMSVPRRKKKRAAPA